MGRLLAIGPAVGAALLLSAFSGGGAAAQGSAASALTEKVNAAIGCMNRLSERAFQSRERYFSWAARTGPTGRERIIYGLYTIYETADCKKNVEAANAIEPHEPELEAAASAYVAAVTALEPLLKEADDYYDQEDYKDDKMAKGKALHPRLVAAWTAFASADEKLRGGIDVLQDRRAAETIAEIERTDGKNERYHIETLMMRAKRVLRTENANPPDIAKITEALAEYEAITKATEEFAAANNGKIGSGFVSSSKTFLTSAKQLMRRIRDKVPYSSGDRMLMNGQGAWMVEGSPARLTRDYNSLVDSYNRGARF